MTSAVLRVLSIVLAGALLLAAAPLEQRGDGASVTIRNSAYQPARVAVKVGQSVTWTNADDRDHTVVADDGSFDSGNLKPGRSYSFRFSRAGSFGYGCSLHPRMKGLVVVE
jgi:plastocyanin